MSFVHLAFDVTVALASAYCFWAYRSIYAK